MRDIKTEFKIIKQDLIPMLFLCSIITVLGLGFIGLSAMTENGVKNCEAVNDLKTCQILTTEAK